jgi:hypothetical protein
VLPLFAVTWLTGDRKDGKNADRIALKQLTVGWRMPYNAAKRFVNE